MAQTGNKNIIKCNLEYDGHIPEVPAHRYLMERMSSHSSRTAVTDTLTGKEWSYKDLVEAVQSFAAALQASEGLSKGQFVGVALPNCAEFAVSILAVMQCGGVASFVNPIYTPRELEHVAGIMRPAFWICIPEFLPCLEQLARSGIQGVSTKAIVINLKDPASSQWHRLLASGKPERFVPPPLNVFQDLATMPFSSGTTGLPKGVMLTHHNIVAALCQFKAWCCYDETDVNLGLLPAYHQYGCLGFLTTFSVGARLVSVPKFVFTDMLQTIQDQKVTMIPLVPPIAILLAKHPIVDKYDLRSVKKIIYASAPLGLDIVSHLNSKYGWEMLQGYGMTECTLATHFTPLQTASNLERIKFPTIGVSLMPFYECKVVDQVTGETLGPHKTGEICVKGPMVMKGYRGNPAATAELIDKDGWLHTGDIGYYDEKDLFYIVERIKELIKYKGTQVAPTELENLLLTHPDVAEAAVIGVPDEMAGELPRAYVVKRAGSSVTEEDIANFVNSRVSSFKHLRGGVVFTPAIPKLASGKILRRELRDQLKSKL